VDMYCKPVKPLTPSQKKLVANIILSSSISVSSVSKNAKINGTKIMGFTVLNRSHRSIKVLKFVVKC